MSNLQEAKESLAKSSQLAAILTPPTKTKNIKLPRLHDITLVENIINQKLKDIKEANNNNYLAKVLTKWAPEIDQIHTKAVSLKKEINSITIAIEQDTNNTIKVNPGYSHYWDKLPQNLKEAKEEDRILEINDDNIPSTTTTIEKEIEEFLLDIKLGIKPISEAKIILEKLNNLT